MTRRYVRNPVRHGKPRTRVPEEVLVWVIDEVRRKRRENVAKTDEKRLKKEDEREEKELRGYTISALVAEMNNIVPYGQSSRTGSDDKAPTSREEAAANWINARHGETENADQDPSRRGP